MGNLFWRPHDFDSIGSQISRAVSHGGRVVLVRCTSIIFRFSDSKESETLREGANMKAFD